MFMLAVSLVKFSVRPPLKTLLFLLTLGAFTQVLSVTAAAQNGLIVTPTILEFEGRDRFGSLTLVNRGTEAYTYRISFVNQRMTEKGTMVRTDTPADNEGFAGQYLRYSPRQITLLPGQPQTIRVMKRLPAGVKEGEYRSHLLFQRLPNTLAPVSKVSSDGGLGVSITARYGISIPVFIRVGTLNAAANITDITHQLSPDNETLLGFTINRSGTKSVRGHITVRIDGKEVGVISGFPVYLSTDKRHVNVKLSSKKMAGKKVYIEYKERAKDGGKIIALAEKQF